VVWLHRSAFGRRLTALGDSPAACATLGVNPIVTKLGVFIISAAIAGFAGALLGVFQGTATVQDFEMLNGLAYLLLLVVGGVAVVSGAVLGGAFLTMFTWLPTILPGWTWLTELGKWQARLGPGLAGIGIGRQPSGVIPTVGEDLRHQNARKRAEREALAAGTPPGPDSPPPTAPPPADVTGAPVASPGA
jgi:branched-chain amino acid transport system permease protein